MILIQGKGVSKGVAIGPLYYYQRAKASITRYEVTDAEAEWARFKEAQAKAIEQLGELAEKAIGSSNAELRAMAVDALSWFGQNALVELTEFMSDADEGVAEEAKSSWMRALQEIEDDGLKAGVVELTLGKLKDKDILEDVANELVGIDELAAVQVLANVIDDGKNAKAVAAAKEAYNSITGDDWSGVDAAEAWLQENYTASEDDSAAD